MSRTDTRSEPAVLVVEDEALQRLDAVATVEAAGFQAIGVSNADEAISMLETRDDIRAVFTDVQIPGSMDGLALTRLVKNRWPKVAALVTSGKTNIAEADLPRGVPFFRKPYLPFQIQAALRHLIAEVAGTNGAA